MTTDIAIPAARTPDWTERLATLDAAIAEGRIIRHAWTRREDGGRQMLCLLAALSPEVRVAETSAACPADVMPAWLAALTPVLNDCGSPAGWPRVVRRYADLAHRWHVLTADDWRWLDCQITALALSAARDRTEGDAAREAMGAAITLCERAATERVWRREWVAAACEMRNAGAPLAWLVKDDWSRERAANAVEGVFALVGEDDPAAYRCADMLTRRVLDAIEARIAMREASPAA